MDQRLRDAGIILFSTATNEREARLAAAARVHAIVAQGYEAGGHRGMFDPDEADEQLGIFVLVGQLVKTLIIPIIAAGGISATQFARSGGSRLCPRQPAKAGHISPGACAPLSPHPSNPSTTPSPSPQAPDRRTGASARLPNVWL